MAKKRIPQDLQNWIDARKRHQLSDAVVQMAREMGLNPKKLGGKANHDQEPWKLPLAEWIAVLYRKRFGRERPEQVLSIEGKAREMARKKAERRDQKRLRKAAAEVSESSAPAGPDGDPSS